MTDIRLVLRVMRKATGALDLLSPAVLGTGKMLSQAAVQERKEHIEVKRMMRKMPHTRPQDADRSDSDEQSGGEEVVTRAQPTRNALLK